MATKSLFRKYYAMLLRLYPRAFQERFGDEMKQTSQDLFQEHIGANRSRVRFALWIGGETLAGIIREHTMHWSEFGKLTLRVALGALAVWMIPFVASQFVDGWNWPAAAFVRVYCLFFLTGMAMALVARRFGAWSYKAGVTISLVAGFALGWSNMVHVSGTENPANLAYYSVLVVGVIGALFARLRPRGLAYTLFAMAFTLALISLLLPSGAPPDLAWRMGFGHAVLTAVFAASGMLFRHASLHSGR